MVLVKHQFSTFDDIFAPAYVSGMTFVPVNYPPKVSPKRERKRKPLAAGDHWIERCAEARELAAAGFTDREMADAFGVSVKQLYIWRAANPDFEAACKLQKAMPDARVQGVAFTMTQGFSYVEQQAIKVKTGEDTEAVEIVEVERYMPPDKTMVLFWLKNRLGWRDQHEHRVEGRVDHEHRHTIEADPRRLAIALLATVRKALEKRDGQQPLTIEGEVSETA